MRKLNRWKRKFTRAGWFMLGMFFSVLIAATGLMGCGHGKAEEQMTVEEFMRAAGHRQTIDPGVGQLLCQPPSHLRLAPPVRSEVTLEELGERFSETLRLDHIEAFIEIQEPSGGIPIAAFHIEGRAGSLSAPQMRCDSSRIQDLQVSTTVNLARVIHPRTGEITPAPRTGASHNVPMKGAVSRLEFDYELYKTGVNRSVILRDSEFGLASTLVEFVRLEGPSDHRYFLGEDGKLRVRLAFRLEEPASGKVQAVAVVGTYEERAGSDPI